MKVSCISWPLFDIIKAITRYAHMTWRCSYPMANKSAKKNTRINVLHKENKLIGKKLILDTSKYVSFHGAIIVLLGWG